MKKLIGVLLSAMFMMTNTYAQKAADEKPETKEIVKPSRDFVMLQLTYDNWNKTPDSINTTGFGRGVGLYLCYDFPIKNSNFSFAAGIGVSTSNIYFKNQSVSLTSNSTAVVFRDVDTSLTGSFKGQKLTTAYLEAPLELRYFSNKNNRNTGFKASIGVKVGYSNFGGMHTKQKQALGGTWITDKESSKKFLEQWRLAPTVRIGYGNFSLVGTYYVTNTFQVGAGPKIYPYQIGICISGL